MTPGFALADQGQLGPPDGLTIQGGEFVGGVRSSGASPSPANGVEAFRDRERRSQTPRHSPDQRRGASRDEQRVRAEVGSARRSEARIGLGEWQADGDRGRFWRGLREFLGHLRPLQPRSAMSGQGWPPITFGRGRRWFEDRIRSGLQACWSGRSYGGPRQWTPCHRLAALETWRRSSRSGRPIFKNKRTAGEDRAVAAEAFRSPVRTNGSPYPSRAELRILLLLAGAGWCCRSHNQGPTWRTASLDLPASKWTPIEMPLAGFQDRRSGPTL